MIRITDGIQIIEVTNGAYKNMYKQLGYKPVKENKAKKQEVEEVELTEDEKFVEEFELTPANSWSKDTLKKYAELKGIDLKGTKNFNEARALVKDIIDGVDEFDEVEELDE